MEAWLRSVKLWSLVSGDLERPVFPPDTITYEQKRWIIDWDGDKDRAAGIIMLMLEQDQKVHVKDKKADPIAMWKKLESVHEAKRPGSRFNALDDFFSIRKLPEETLPALVNRIEAAMQKYKNLRPADFTIDQMDDELNSMAMVRSLPEEYSTFASTLLLLDKLDKSVLQQAFHTEETQRRQRATTEAS